MERNRCQGNRGIPEPPPGGEDMPRKSLDKRLTDDPVQRKRGCCALFLPSGKDGFGQSPKTGQGTGPLWGLGQRPKVFKHQYLQFSRFIGACFSRLSFHRLLDTTLLISSLLPAGNAGIPLLHYAWHSPSPPLFHRKYRFLSPFSFLFYNHKRNMPA